MFCATSLHRRLGIESLEDRTVPTLLGNQLYPGDNPWNQKITSAPVAANSAAILNQIVTTYGNGRLHPDFGQKYGTHTDLYGIPYNVVHGNSTPKINVVIDAYPDESDIISAPIPSTVVLEGDYQDGPKVGVDNRGDSHLLLYDVDNNVAYEFYRMSRPSENSDGRWHADQETVWDMKTNTFRTLGWTSADAAGLSLLAGLVRPDEGLPVNQGGQGVINHAIRFTLRNAVILDQFLYPASHTANPGNNNPAVQPPMGARFRLKASVDISQLNPQSKIIAQAMKDYGMIIADNGSNFFFSGASYSVNASNQQMLTWDDNDIQSSTNGLKSLHFSDFEVIDLTPVVTGLSTRSGSAGNSVTITGANFSGAAGNLKVLFGNNAASSVNVLSDTQIVATAPAGTGTVNVRVQSGSTTASNADNVNNTIFGYGFSAVNANSTFTYSTTQAPTITSGDQKTFQVGQRGSFTITTSGAPVPALALTGNLPRGVTFTDNHNGTATLSGTPATGTAGVYSLVITANNGVNPQAQQTFSLTVVDPPANPIYAVGSDTGIPAVVTWYDSAGTQTELRPYGTFQGGVRVATGDVDGDGVRDLVIAAGPGGVPNVKAYSGSTREVLFSFNPYDTRFRGGVYIATGDVLGLGAAQIVVGPGSGAAPYVRVYQFQGGLRLRRNLLIFSSSYRGGVTVGANAGILATATPENAGVVKIYDQQNLSRIRTLYPFGNSYRDGLQIAIGNDWLAIAQGRRNGDVRIYGSAGLEAITTIQPHDTPWNPNYTGGTRVAWAQFSDATVELLIGTGPGRPATVQFWVTGTWQRRTQQSELDGALTGVWLG